MRASRFLIAAAALAALPAVAQDTTANSAQPAPAQPQPQPQPQLAPVGGSIDSIVTELTDLDVAPPRPPVELPAHARRDPSVVGALSTASVGLPLDPWGNASGAYLSTLMRRMDTPIASRWAHITMRNALLARARAPRNVNPVDWTAERAWLLLRMGEADGARMLVAGTDVDRFTPKMYQVAVQTALATSDPPALCPLLDGIKRYERSIDPAVEAICSALAGEPESASAQIESVRRRGRMGGIDLILAEKVIGAGSDTARAVTVEWEPVDRLSAWRFGLATATGLVPPDRLINAAAPRVRAWQARSPMLSPEQRLSSARIAAALGVLSSQSLVDIYSLIYDATDPDQLSNTDAWQLRQAYLARDANTRMGALRRLWDIGNGPMEEEASRALVGRAAALIVPDAALELDAPKIVASILSAGLDRRAAAWSRVVRQLDEEPADRVWAMIALAAPDTNGIDVSVGRINSFVSRDDSPNKRRSAFLVAGLAGLGRLDTNAADRLNRRYGLGIGRSSRWTNMIDAAAGMGQAGTVAVMTGTGLQTRDLMAVPGAHLYHAVAALRRTGQDFAARMIAAEALART